MAAALPTPAYSVSSTSSHLDITMSDDSAFKRKRPLDDIGDRDHKKVHREGNALGIEDLHLDVGEKYLLLQNSSGGQTRKAPLTGPLLFYFPVFFFFFFLGRRRLSPT